MFYEVLLAFEWGSLGLELPFFSLSRVCQRVTRTAHSISGLTPLLLRTTGGFFFFCQYFFFFLSSESSLKSFALMFLCHRLYLSREELDNPHKSKTWDIYKEDFGVTVIFTDPWGEHSPTAPTIFVVSYERCTEKLQLKQMLTLHVNL